MRASLIRFLAQICILTALATSMALLVDSLGATPAYCSGPSGCLAAKLAARKVLGAVPLPLLGLLSFLGWLVAITAGGFWARRLELVGAFVAAPIALGLLLVQAWVLGTFCPLCVVVDVSAVVAAAAVGVARHLERNEKSPTLILPSAMAGLVVVACAAPLAWPYYRPASAVPAPIAEFSVPNRVTVVEFVDLSCSHCRELYPTLEQFRKERGDRIHFTRLHAPLHGHRQARQAARLLQCLEPDDQRIEQLTRILFETPQLDRSAILGAAESVGMTEDQISACWDQPESAAALDDNVQRLEALGFQGLPTTYIGGERIVGAMPLSHYIAALDRVERSMSSARGEVVTFFGLLGAFVLGLLVVGRRRAEPTMPRGSSSESTPK